MFVMHALIIIIAMNTIVIQTININGILVATYELLLCTAG
jgi:hypothetical protein